MHGQNPLTKVAVYLSQDGLTQFLIERVHVVSVAHRFVKAEAPAVDAFRRREVVES